MVQVGKIPPNSHLNHYVVVGMCGQGEIFGEHGSLNDLASPFGVEVVSDSAIVYKIHRLAFINNFGGIGSDPANELRGNIISKNNWMAAKLEMLTKLSSSQLEQVEVISESHYMTTQPTKQEPHEVPYLHRYDGVKIGARQVMN